MTEGECHGSWQDLLELYLDDRLPPVERDRVEQALARDPAVRRELMEVLSCRGLLEWSLGGDAAPVEESCRWVRPALRRYREGRLPQEDLVAVSHHVDYCLACQSYGQQLEELGGASPRPRGAAGARRPSLAVPALILVVVAAGLGLVLARGGGERAPVREMPATFSTRFAAALGGGPRELVQELARGLQNSLGGRRDPTQKILQQVLRESGTGMEAFRYPRVDALLAQAGLEDLDPLPRARLTLLVGLLELDPELLPDLLKGTPLMLLQQELAGEHPEALRALAWRAFDRAGGDPLARRALDVLHHLPPARNWEPQWRYAASRARELGMPMALVRALKVLAGRGRGRAAGQEVLEVLESGGRLLPEADRTPLLDMLLESGGCWSQEVGRRLEAVAAATPHSPSRAGALYVLAQAPGTAARWRAELVALHDHAAVPVRRLVARFLYREGTREDLPVLRRLAADPEACIRILARPALERLGR